MHKTYYKIKAAVQNVKILHSVDRCGTIWYPIFPNVCDYNARLLIDRLLNYLDRTHAYQSLACETAINTDFSELFSLKRIYVKYENAILSLID